jgi:hypothetical protein
LELELQAFGERATAEEDCSSGFQKKHGLYVLHYLHTRRAHGGLTMYNDPIVEEVRRARDEYAKQFNYDVPSWPICVIGKNCIPKGWLRPPAIRS